MYGLKELLNKEEERLLRIKAVVDKQLDEAPEGRLRISSSGKLVQYMHCTDENKKSIYQGNYIKKENAEFIKALAQKGYDKKVKRLVDLRLKQIQKINADYDDHEIEFDSMINPPRNREAGYPRVGRYVADPAAREKIEQVVNKWIDL